jgi:glutaredoxin
MNPEKRSLAMRIRFLVPLLLLPVLAQAQLYRWVDDSGMVHYSDRIPVSGARNVQKQSIPAEQASSAALPYTLQQAVKNFPVTLYTSEVCKDACARAREQLDKRGVPYRETGVRDAAEIEQLKQLSGDIMVPVMTVGREVYKGFESAIFKTALDNAGYPASSLLPPGVQARTLVAKPVTKPAAAAPPADAAGTGGEPAAAPQETTAAPKQ